MDISNKLKKFLISQGVADVSYDFSEMEDSMYMPSRACSCIKLYKKYNIWKQSNRNILGIFIGDGWKSHFIISITPYNRAVKFSLIRERYAKDFIENLKVMTNGEFSNE